MRLSWFSTTWSCTDRVRFSRFLGQVWQLIDSWYFFLTTRMIRLIHNGSSLKFRWIRLIRSIFNKAKFTVEQVQENNNNNNKKTRIVILSSPKPAQLELARAWAILNEIFIHSLTGAYILEFSSPLEGEGGSKEILWGSLSKFSSKTRSEIYSSDLNQWFNSWK